MLALPAGLNGFDQVYTFGAYEGVLRKLIHLFKFEGVRTLAAALGRAAGASPAARADLRRDRAHAAALAPPLAARFNQSDLLAREIARRWNVPLRRWCAARKRPRRRPGFTSAQRRKNVQGAFEVKDRASVKGKRILLIDDVLTTGATASACARALKRAGAAQVTLLALARRDRRAGFESSDGFGRRSGGWLRELIRRS